MAHLHNCNFYEFLPPYLRKDRSIVHLALLMGDEDVLNYMPEEFYKDEELLYIMAQNGFSSILFRYPPILKNKKLLKCLLKNNGQSIQFMSNELRNDKEMALIALKSDWETIKYLGKELKKDVEIVLCAAKENQKALQYADMEVLKNPNFTAELFQQLL